MAFQMVLPIPGFPELVFVSFGVFAFLMVFQSPTARVSKTRMLLTALLMAAIVAVSLSSVSAYGDFPVEDHCKNFEEGSWGWWFWQCWISK